LILQVNDPADWACCYLCRASP